MDRDRSGRAGETMANSGKKSQNIPEFLDFEVDGIPYEPFEYEEDMIWKKRFGYWWRSSLDTSSDS